jgi:hypothetical protein
MAAQKVDTTLATWQPYYAQTLSEDDGREIRDNWSAYVSLISQWTTSLMGRKAAER